MHEGFSLATPDFNGGWSGEDVNLTMSILMHGVVQLACRPTRVSVITAMGIDSHCLPALACCSARLIARIAQKVRGRLGVYVSDLTRNWDKHICSIRKLSAGASAGASAVCCLEVC